MYYDLHIHSALSPCSEDEMTLNNIVNMSLLKGLDLIAITDHNSMKQQACLLTVAKNKIHVLLGVEIQSSDGIHILGYFNEKSDISKIQAYLDKHLIVKMNHPDYYGHQWILNEKDEVVGKEERLLISSLDVNCSEVIEAIHTLGGKAILAHIYRKYGYLEHYGSLDESLHFDGVEVLPEYQQKVLDSYPFLKNKIVLCDSDAHYLGMINEAEFSLSDKEYQFLRGEIDA